MKATKKDLIKNMGALLHRITSDKNLVGRYIELCKELNVNTTEGGEVRFYIKKTETLKNLEILTDVITAVLC